MCELGCLGVLLLARFDRLLRFNFLLGGGAIASSAEVFLSSSFRARNGHCEALSRLVTA